MNIKKIFAILLAATLVLVAFVGCTQTQEDDSGANNKNNDEILVYEDLTYAVNADGTYEITGYTYTGAEDKAVKIPETIDNRKVTGIKADAFKYNNKTITAIEIPSTVTYIGNYAFFDCDAIKSVVIPDSVVTIGQGAFQSCGSLESVTLPAGLKAIDRFTFLECKALKSITIPETVESIGASAFRNCESLTEVTIPASVKDLGDAAFYECVSLTKATVLGSALGLNEKDENGNVVKKHTIGEIVFHGCYTDPNATPTLTISVTVDTPFANYVAAYEDIGVHRGVYKVVYYTVDGVVTEGPNHVDDEGTSDPGVPGDPDDDNWTEIA